MATNGHGHPEPSAPPYWPDHALRTYLRHSTLPKLPKSPRAPTTIQRRRSHRNWLEVRYRPERTFQAVQRVDDPHWLPGLQRCTFHLRRGISAKPIIILNPPFPPADLSTVIDGYDESIEDIPGEWITAPAKAPSDRTWLLPCAHFEPPSDLGKIASIIDEIVLRTNERAMHVNNPHEAPREWTWILNDEFEDNVDRALIRTFSWMNWSMEEDSAIHNLSEDDSSQPLSLEMRSDPTIILFVQAPWILTKEDFKLFWTLESVRYIPLLTLTLNFRQDAKGKPLQRTYI